MNLVKESHLPKSIEDITNTVEETTTLRRWSQASHGLVLVSGRSGSGKTTTTFCCLEELARSRTKMIFTLEPSVEFLVPNVEQIEVDLHDDRASQMAFEAVMASDADVLFISSSLNPTRQASLCRQALAAAESGHLVFVQLDALSTDDARNMFETAVGRSIEDQLVGISWQELSQRDASGRRTARYTFNDGRLGQPVH